MAHILIVEDESATAWALAESLREEGYETRHAASAEDALASLRAHATDLVITDLRLPGMSGAQLARRLRSGKRRLPLAGYQFASMPRLGQDVVLGIRPEHLDIIESGTWPDFKVDIVEPMGADTVIWCSDGEGPIQVRTNGSKRASRGDALSIHVDPAQISLFAADTGERL